MSESVSYSLSAKAICPAAPVSVREGLCLASSGDTQSTQIGFHGLQVGITPGKPTYRVSWNPLKEGKNGRIDTSWDNI